MLEHHLKDLYSSGLTDESIAKYDILSINKDEASKQLGFPAPSGGWAIYYPGSHFLKFKPDAPFRDAKYLSPKGMAQDLFITHLARKNCDDTSIPYVFCEGEKKAAACEQAGYNAIAVAGVWNFLSQGHIIEQLTRINIKDRVCYIIFDSDKYNNKHVLKAEKRFSDVLLSLGAKVKIVNLEARYGKGVDDVLLNLKGDFKRYMDTAVDYEKQPNKILSDEFNIEISPVEIAENICHSRRIMYCAYNYYKYQDGVYKRVDEEEIKQWIIEVVGSEITKRESEEILYFIATKSYVSPDKVNDTRYINLKNGLFDLSDNRLYPHTPEVFSTIQLTVNYNPAAKCDKWLKTLDEIFEGDGEKIVTLQEFIGLCLTKETKYEKALLLIGDGANGKSVILNTTEKFIGRDNVSAIPLDKFNNTHYVANLFGKLANISIETNAKSEVYDSIFKAVISGDIIEADLKFKNSFRFNPFCKLIFAMNNLPRVDDKTDAFFRRLLILRFNKQFEEEEQNKNLREELQAELDGIFIWCLEGLKRLKARGYFNISKKMKSEIDDYRRENNNIIVFVDEQCRVGADEWEAKDKLYEAYSEFCKNNGYRALSKIKFGKELAKQCKSVTEDRSSDERKWLGIAHVAPWYSKE